MKRKSFPIDDEQVITYWSFECAGMRCPYSIDLFDCGRKAAVAIYNHRQGEDALRSRIKELEGALRGIEE